MTTIAVSAIHPDFFNTFITLSSYDMAQEGGYATLNRRTGFQIQLMDLIDNRYSTIHFQLEGVN